jgi:hypothetical protein
MALSPPRLLSDLRSTLSSLYHASSTTPTPLSTVDAAHAYLMQFQSRNLRRWLQSQQQRQRDIQQQHSSPSSETHPPTPIESSPHLSWGSTWWASLVLLWMPDATPTEQLFAAQTLAHRVRRMKLVDAIDVDMETIDGDVPHDNPMQQLRTFVSQQLVHLHPLVAAALASLNETASSTADGAKGHVMLMALAVTAYKCAASYNLSDESVLHQHLLPLLSTLGASMAAIVLRIRFNNNHRNHDSENPCMVSLLMHTWHIVQHVTGTDVVPRAWALSLTVTLAALPDVVLGNPGGSRGRLSMDPHLVQAASMTLRTTSVDAVWHALHILPHGTPVAWVLQTCASWARHVPLSTTFLHHTLPLLQQSLLTEDSRASWDYLLAIMEGGSWTLEQILTSQVGMSERPQGSRSSSCSKRRQKEVLTSRTTPDTMEQARQEMIVRGSTACQAASYLWRVLYSAFHRELSTGTGNGEGPMYCMMATAHACLPHMVRQSCWNESLVQGLSQALFSICSHANRNVRGWALEPLFHFHAAIVEECRVRPQSFNDVARDSIVHMLSTVSTDMFNDQLKCDMNHI